MRQLLRVAKSHLFRRKPFEDPAIFHLDEYLLHMIYQNLSLIDQACLSLSCKMFFGLFGTISQHEDFVFPRLLSMRSPILCVNNRDVPRNQLLIRLENRRWACCSRCLRLHPRKAFSRDSLEYPAMQRLCMNDAGIAGLCPCVSLMHRDRARVIKFLEAPITSMENQKRPSKFLGSLFQVLVDQNQKPYLLHTCIIDNNTGYEAHLGMALSLGEATTLPTSRKNVLRRKLNIQEQADQLIMKAQYEIRFSSSRALFKAEPISACPHFDILSLARWNLASESCLCCETRIEMCPSPNDTDSAIFTVTRDLGSRHLPADNLWYGQCRLTGWRFPAYSVYWQVH